MAVFAFGIGTPVKPPQVNLQFVANTTNLTINQQGGDSLVLKDEITTIRKSTDNTIVQVPMPLNTWGSASTLTAGGTLRGNYSATGVIAGDILTVTLQDVPSGQLVINSRVVVTS